MKTLAVTGAVGISAGVFLRMFFMSTQGPVSNCSNCDLPKIAVSCKTISDSSYHQGDRFKLMTESHGSLFYEINHSKAKQGLSTPAANLICT
jgi:hypothetical protein